MKIKCTACKEHKECDQFNNWSRSANGKQSQCRVCSKSLRDRKQYDLKRRNAPDYAQQNQLRNREYSLSTRGRATLLYNSAKKRAIEKGLDFTITVPFIEYFLLLRVCPRTGFDFDFTTDGRGRRNMYAPSVDRINNDEGYTFANVQVVCDMYNHGKGQHTDEDFILFCHRVAMMNPLGGGNIK